MTTPVQKSDIEALLKKRRWLLPLPAPLIPLYLQQRVQEFTRLASLISLPLLLILAVLLAGLFSIYSNELSVHDRHIILLGEGLTVVLVTLGISIAQRNWGKQFFNHWIPIVFAIFLANKIVISGFLQSTELINNYNYATLLSLIVGTLTLQLTTLAAVVSCLLALPAFLILYLQPEKHGFSLTFLVQYGITAVTCLLVVIVREDKDRIAFLHSVLLDMEKNEVTRLNGELNLLAQLDTLTGLANRRCFDITIDDEWERGRRSQSPLSLLIIDIDHFKLYNDNCGHLAGDEVLRQVGAVLASAIQRPSDLAARYGGEEFILLLPNTREAGAVKVAKRLLAAMDTLNLPHPASPTAQHVTFSIGIATTEAFSGCWQSLVAAADEALYQAKEQGRRCFRVGQVRPF